jgi:lipid A ethanolaminephosphotransferase
MPLSLPIAAPLAGLCTAAHLALRRMDEALAVPRSPRRIVLWLTAWLMLSTNWTLWLDIARLSTGGMATLHALAAMGVLTAGATAAMLVLTAWPCGMKPVWFTVVLIAAFAQHYMLTYHVVMDPTMMVNVMQTDVHEARDMLSARLLVDVLLVAGPAGWALWRVRIARQGAWTHVWRNAVLLVAALAVGLWAGMLGFRVLGPLMRNNVELRYTVNPLSSIYSTLKQASDSVRSKGPLATISGDAALGATYVGNTRPPLFVLVVGETARGDHFSLNGYGRLTNPRLAQAGVLSWTHLQSCGTSTAASVPCMFSPLGKSGFEARKNNSENLLDVLSAAGLAVLWIDNQSGCKGVCARVPSASTACDADECLDDVLLQGLDARIAALPAERRARGIVVVLHQIGSHGPAYSRRSGPTSKHFLPECRNVTLSACTHDELVNAFDNSIVATDAMLADTIVWLRGQSAHFDTGMLYMSDHGESLGENGLFLHGMPYVFAPDEQKHAAMIGWLNGGLAARTGVRAECVAQGLARPVTHDVLYHTVLGLMDVHSATYRPSLDGLEGCRSAR